MIRSEINVLAFPPKQSTKAAPRKPVLALQLSKFHSFITTGFYLVLLGFTGSD